MLLGCAIRGSLPPLCLLNEGMERLTFRVVSIMFPVMLALEIYLKSQSNRTRKPTEDEGERVEKV